MAETLTYDPGTDSTTLTTDEQESLEVGEKLVAEQEGLLAGKYKNAEELEQGYLELQKKFGTEETEAKEEVTQTEEPVEEVSSQVTLINDASAEYAEKGELSQETLAKFSEMSSKDLVEAYMEANTNAQQAVVDLTEAQVRDIQDAVGGKDAYGNIISWGVQNLPKDTMDSFDTLVNTTGNPKTIELAVAGIKAQMENATGYEGRMLSGKSPQASGDVFKSQASLVEAMNDPRYENDPAYRQDVIAKLERSDNLQF